MIEIKNGGGIQGNKEDLLAFAELLKPEGFIVERDIPLNTKCLSIYNDGALIFRNAYHDSVGGSKNNRQFVLPQDKIAAYLHFAGKKLVEDTPKFKVGDRVKLISNSIESMNKIGELGTITKLGSVNTDRYLVLGDDTKSSYSCWSQESDLELIKEKSTNMKYKVIKWYPGCEVTKERVGEVIETSNDYSTAEYREFYEKVKVNSLEEAVKASGLKIGDYLDNQKVKIHSEQIASSRGKERHTLTNYRNLTCTHVKVLEFAMIQNVPCARIMFTSESDIWVAISDLKTVPKPEMNFSDAGFDYTETKDYVQIGCQRYTLEDTKAFLLTMNRAELNVLNFKSGRLPVTKQQIMYVHNLLNK